MRDIHNLIEASEVVPGKDPFARQTWIIGNLLLMVIILKSSLIRLLWFRRFMLALES